MNHELKLVETRWRIKRLLYKHDKIALLALPFEIPTPDHHQESLNFLQRSLKMETWSWILGWSLSILTVVGNGFVIFIVCRKRQLRTKTNVFIVSLAVADFCVGVSVVPSLFFCDKASGCNPQGVFFKVIMSISELFSYASATSLCSLVLDRYMAIVKPLKYLTFMKRRRVTQMISLSWGISVTFAVFVRTLKHSLKTPFIECIIGWFYSVFELLLCVIVIFCFASMLNIVYKHDRSARRLAKQLCFNHRNFSKTRDNSALKMMAIVICLFLVYYGLLLRCSVGHIFKDHKSCIDNKYILPIRLF